MNRFVAGIVFGLLLAVGAVFAWRNLHARQMPQPTSQVINQPTKARQVRELKRGRDPDQRFVPMKVERH